MKKNSHNKKASFKWIGLIGALLLIGIIFGKNIVVVTIMYTAIFAIAILISGAIAFLIYSIKEELERKRKLKDENTLSD